MRNRRVSQLDAVRATGEVINQSRKPSRGAHRKLQIKIGTLEAAFHEVKERQIVAAGDLFNHRTCGEVGDSELRYSLVNDRKPTVRVDGG